MIIRLIVIAFVLMPPCFLHAGEEAENPQEIRLSSDTWHSLTMADGKGLYFDLIRAVYEPQGIKVSFVIVPYARSVELVKAKKVDGWVASFLNEQPFPLYPKWHFDRNRQVVVSLKGGKKLFSGMESLRGRSVIWLRDFNLNKYIPVPLSFQEIDDITGAFPMLTAGRADFFICAESDIENAIKENHIERDRYSIDFLMNLEIYIAFADTDRGRRFRRIWDEQMASLSKDPKFHAIYERYGYSAPFD